MLTKQDIVAVVVLYNPNKKVYDNILKYKGLVNRLILVDNSLTNNKYLFKNIDFVDYIPLYNNYGIAYALNLGIKNSTEKYILTMDQDSAISANLINSYLKFLNVNDNNGIGALTCQYNTDRNPAVAKKGYVKVRQSMQSGTLFKRSTFDKIGYFDDKLFIDVVDLEFFLRMKRSELSLVRINAAVLNHHPAETKVKKILFLKLKYGQSSEVRNYYKARNLFWVAKRYNSLDMYKGLTISWLKIILLYDDKRKYLKAFNQGIRDANNNQLGKYYSNYEGN
jgi:rhamnosyltransferase